jgi:hypothetical protein
MFWRTMLKITAFDGTFPSPKQLDDVTFLKQKKHKLLGTAIVNSTNHDSQVNYSQHSRSSVSCASPNRDEERKALETSKKKEWSCGLV